MLNKFIRWLDHLNNADPIKQQQARALQIILVVLLGLIFILAFSIFVAPIARIVAIGLFMLSMGLFIVLCYALWLLRHQRIDQAVITTTMTITLFLIITVFSTGINGSGASLFGFSLPLAIAALMSGRRTLWLVLSVSIVGLVAVAVIERIAPQYVGFARPRDLNIIGVVGSYTGISMVFALILGYFTATLYQAIHSSVQRERELQAMGDSLEQLVAERTASLQRTLDELEQTTSQQQRLLDLSNQQADVIRAMSVPVIPVGRSKLVVPLIGILNQERMGLIAGRVLDAIQHQSATIVLLDLTGVHALDHAAAVQIRHIIYASQLLGTTIVLVGINPEVAQSFVALGMYDATVPCFGSLAQALECL
ncbi:MAG: STAS domain-containing protein [Herpetosiphon sp.]|nr:STAS domain-containing protein [Herpetosiphon sp.]